jgi:hypothetical protein
MGFVKLGWTRPGKVVPLRTEGILRKLKKVM